MRIMHEDDAKNVWCPFITVSSVGSGLGFGITNRGRHVEPSDVRKTVCCIAKDCMAWEQDSPRAEFGFCSLTLNR